MASFVQPCPEACLQAVKVTTNYTCALHYVIKPQCTEHKIGVYSDNNGQKPEYFLMCVDTPPTTRTVTLKVCFLAVMSRALLRDAGQVPAGQIVKASYSLFMELVHPVDSTSCAPVYIDSGEYVPLKIASTA